MRLREPPPPVLVCALDMPAAAELFPELKAPILAPRKFSFLILIRVPRLAAFLLPLLRVFSSAADSLSYIISINTNLYLV